MVRSLDWEHIKAIFTHTIDGNYVPLTIFSFAIEYRFFGYEAFIYHFDNVLLHAINACLVFFLALRFGLNLRASLIAALFFGLHPINVESVAWVTERKDVLHGFFYLLALNFYSLFLVKEKRLFYYAAMLCSVLAMLAKPAAVTLPLVLFIFDWYFGRKWKPAIFWEKLPFVVFAALIAQITYLQHERVFNLNTFFSWSVFSENILSRVWAYLFYLREFLFPKKYFLFYLCPAPLNLNNPQYQLSLIIFITVATLIVFLRKHRLLVFAFFFYTATISVVLLYLNVDYFQAVTVRFMYLSKIGFCLFGGYLFENVLQYCRRPLSKALIGGVIVSLLVSLSLKTIRQCRVWQNSVVLWSYQLRHNPQNLTSLLFLKLAEAHSNLPSFVEKLQRVRTYKMSVQSSLTGEGDLYLQKDMESINLVIHLFQQSIRLKPNFAAAYIKLSEVYKAMGEEQKAIEYFHKGIKLIRKKEEAYYWQAGFYRDLGKIQEAIQFYYKALDVNPINRDIYHKIIRDLKEIVVQENASLLYKKALEDILHVYRRLFEEDSGNVFIK